MQSDHIESVRPAGAAGPRQHDSISSYGTEADKYEEYTSIHTRSSAGRSDSYRGSGATTWTIEEERHVIRKLDCRVLGVFCAILLVVNINHNSLFVGLTDNLLKDAHVSHATFDNGLMLERLAILISEFPLQYLVLRFGFRTVFPPLLIVWGILSSSQAFVIGRGSFLVLRSLIGLLEGGYQAGMAYYFTQFYRHDETPTRLAVLLCVADASSIVAHLAGAGVLKMRGVADKPGWFWLFILQGGMVILAGLISYFCVPRSPKLNQTVFHAQPWLNDRERSIAVNRILMDDPLKGIVGQPEHLTWKELVRCWTDKKLWLLYLSGILGMISLLPIRQYFPLILSSLGFDTFRSNMLMVPAQVLKMLTVWGLARSSQYFDEKAFHCALAHFWAFPMLCALESLPGKHMQWERYTVTSLLIATPQYCPIVIAWLSQSCYSVKKRAMAISTYVVSVMLGTIVAAQVYRPEDRPYYRTANVFLMIVTATTSITFVVQRFMLKRTNERRERAWQQMNAQQQAMYAAETRDMEFDGNRRLDFRFPI